jgi:glycosyltransferase involved in cell wall biosynthesis
MPKDIKIGIIGRADNTGLGVETWEVCRHFPETKALIVSLAHIKEHQDLYALHLERFENPIVINGVPDDYEIRAFLQGVDVLFCIETPYNRNTFEIAREMGVKTILRVNYEWLDDYRPDLFLAPSLYHFNEIPGPKEYLPFPINRDVLPFKLRKKAKKFIHIAGNMKAAEDRNGTFALLEAIPHLKSDIEIVIKSQVPLVCADPRVRVDVANHANYWEIWEDADVFICPRRYAGQSLPLNEAMSLGMAVIMTDMEPQNGFLPSYLLVKPLNIRPYRIKKDIEIADISLKGLIATIDGIAGKDISKYSKISNKIAESWSWKTLKPKYEKIFKNL